MEDLTFFHQFAVDKFERDNLALVQENDECVKTHSSVAQYWQSKKALEQLSSGDWENITLDPSEEVINPNYHGQHRESLNRLEQTVRIPEFFGVLCCLTAMVLL